MKFARQVIDGAQHLVGADHLRDRLGRYERADLDRGQACAEQLLDEGDAVRDADGRLLVLQAVARAHLDDADRVAHGLSDTDGSTTASSTPSWTISPTLHLIVFRTPANGARSVCSIFITSRVRI